MHGKSESHSPYWKTPGRDLKKRKALVHSTSSKCPDTNLLAATTLNKILWHADALLLGGHGEPITKKTYIKRPFGPVPKHILEIIKKLEGDDAIAMKNVPFLNYERREFVSITPLPPSALLPMTEFGSWPRAVKNCPSEQYWHQTSMR